MNTETFIKKTAERIYEISSPEKIDRGIHFGHLEEEFMKDTKSLMVNFLEGTDFDPQAFPFVRWENSGDVKLGSRALSKPGQMALANFPTGTEAAFALMELAGVLIKTPGIKGAWRTPEQMISLEEMLKGNKLCEDTYNLLVTAVAVKNAYKELKVNQLNAFIVNCWAKMNLLPLTASSNASSEEVTQALEAFEKLDSRSKIEAFILLKAHSSKPIKPELFKFLPVELSSFIADSYTLDNVFKLVVKDFKFNSISNAETTLNELTTVFANGDFFEWAANGSRIEQLHKATSLSEASKAHLEKNLLNNYSFSEELQAGSNAEKCVWLLTKAAQDEGMDEKSMRSVYISLSVVSKVFLTTGSSREIFMKITK